MARGRNPASAGAITPPGDGTTPAAQSSLGHINTPLLQGRLAEPAWAKKLSGEDRRGLTALFWSNINPYGTFRLDMNLSGVTISGQRAAVSERAEANPATR